MTSQATTDAPDRRPEVLRTARRRTARIAVAVLAAAGVVAGLAAPAAMAAPARHATVHVATPATKTPIVVKAATRKGFGKILVTAKGGALYRDTNDGPNDPTCTGSCASIWPPLVLPAGDTTPKGGKGVTGLGTVKLANGDLQVTYNPEPLYTFVGDSGKSVNGNGDGPFLVVPA
jgi:predicted lipoprotein with Yx(FWY)xxD motif